MVRRGKGKSRILVIMLFLFVVFSSVYITRSQNLNYRSDDVAKNAGGTLLVHFIDVGQADSVLIQSGEYNMLVDAGNNADAELVMHYLRNAGVTRLDYLIATHGHEDHIGSLDTVIYYFSVGELFMPRQSHDTDSYQDVLSAIEDRNIQVTVPEFNEVRSLGEAKFVFVSPDMDKNYKRLNDSSIGIRITNGTHSFLMCGDAGKELEKSMIESNIYLRSNVLKINHHGGDDTTSEAFLDAVAPEFVVITCADENKYGHPHEKTLKKLREREIDAFRTDIQGTIVFFSDGNQLISNHKALEAR